MLSPVKIALIALIVGVVLITNIAATPSLFTKRIPEETTSAPAETLQKTPSPLSKNPITWLNYPAGQSVSAPQTSPTNQEQAEDKSAAQKLFGELKNFFIGGTGAEQPNRDEIESYYSELTKAKQNTGGFTIEEFTAIKKDGDGRPLFPEELFKLAENNDNSDSIKISFRAWQKLAERYLVNLRKAIVGDALLPTHQAMIGWIEYFIEVHRKLGSGNLSKAEIDSLLNQYRQKAKTELPKIQKVLSLSQPTVSANLNRFLGLIPDLIPKVFAQEQTLTCDFGGAVDYTTPCCNGVIIFLQTPPGRNFCGGALMLDFVEIIRVYEYGYFGPGACILGKARRGPGVCLTGSKCASSAAGSGAIMYYGSAATTNFCLIK